MIVFSASLLVLMILAIKPVPRVGEDRCKTIHGTLDHVFEGGDADLVIRLINQEQIFYINRGLSRDL